MVKKMWLSKAITLTNTQKLPNQKVGRFNPRKKQILLNLFLLQVRTVAKKQCTAL